MGAILAAIVSAFLIGSAARWIVPGPDPMPFWLTVLIGLVGSLVGGGIAAGIFGTSDLLGSSSHIFVTLLLEIGAATALVVAYRRFVQRRPLTGPGAYRFPTRGVGITQTRARLRHLGIDPDKLTAPGRPPVEQPPRGEDSAAEELEKLRELRDKGILTAEEYERASERLRRS